MRWTLGTWINWYGEKTGLKGQVTKCYHVTSLEGGRESVLKGQAQSSFSPYLAVLTPSREAKHRAGLSLAFAPLFAPSLQLHAGSHLPPRAGPQHPAPPPPPCVPAPPSCSALLPGSTFSPLPGLLKGTGSAKSAGALTSFGK